MHWEKVVSYLCLRVVLFLGIRAISSLSVTFRRQEPSMLSATQLNTAETLVWSEVRAIVGLTRVWNGLG